MRLCSLVLALLLTATAARADQITSFGQLGTINTFFALNNGDGTTSLDALAAVSITNIVSGATDPNALFVFEAESLGDAEFVLGGNAIVQQFAGSFNLTTADGTFSYLSGDFGGALMFGGTLGTGATFTANTNLLSPLVLFTDLPVTLTSPESFSLSLSNLTPPLTIVGDSIGSFSASVTGTADAEVLEAVPEPTSLVLLGTGLVLLGRRRWMR